MHTGTIILLVMAIYFCLLVAIAYLAGRKSNTNDAFFTGNKKSPWYIVAFGMIGSSISGVSFISVPGMVRAQDMTYMQMVFGFCLGYITIAYVLLPLYYRLNLITIYGYLQKRFGLFSYKTGASFFILSKTIGAGARLFLVVFILHRLVFSTWGIPFYMVASGTLLLIWAYTYKSGIKAIVWTDTLQTCCLLLALFFIVFRVINQLEFNFTDTIQAVSNDPHFRIFNFEWSSTQNFFKQFLSGVFIAIVMNGLDQDMMQKSLTIKKLKDAQKNLISFGIIYIPVNLLFLALGILLMIFTSRFQIPLPDKSDEILPYLATNYLGLPVLIFFSIGIIAAAFSSADSALTSITTTICVDLLNIDKEENARKSVSIRRKVHILISILFFLVVILINYLGQDGILNTIYKIASYTYGPLLGLFFFGLFTKLKPRDKFVPVICILPPVVCFALEVFLKNHWEYAVGNEILLINGLFTVAGLYIASMNKKRASLI